MRQYDPTIGQFFSTKPLFEKFREQTPYQNSFTNPVSFKDPTGLEPEKERGGEDEMLFAEIQEEMDI